jgi:hypothetical protein
MTGREILDDLKRSNFLICDRTNGLIKPTTMKVGSFEDLLKSKFMRQSSYKISNTEKHYIYFTGGIYQILPGGTFKNIHAKIRKLINEGYLRLERGSLKEDLRE